MYGKCGVFVDGVRQSLPEHPLTIVHIRTSAQQIVMELAKTSLVDVVDISQWWHSRTTGECSIGRRVVWWRYDGIGNDAVCSEYFTRSTPGTLTIICTAVQLDAHAYHPLVFTQWHYAKCRREYGRTEIVVDCCVRVRVAGEFLYYYHPTFCTI
jgi:hypothetical protein